MRLFRCVLFLPLVLGCGPSVEEMRAASQPKYSPVEFFVNYYKYETGDGCTTTHYFEAQPETLRTERVGGCRYGPGSTDWRYQFHYSDDDGDHYSYQVAITYDDEKGTVSESNEFVYDGTEQVLFKDGLQRIGMRPLSPEGLEIGRARLERYRGRLDAT